MTDDQSPAFNTKPLPWFEILDTAFRRKYWILSFGLMGVVAGFVISSVLPPLYRAVARIQLTAKAVSGPREAAMSDEQIQAELALIKSSKLIRSVLEDSQPGSDAVTEDAKTVLEPGFADAALQSAKTVWASLRGVTPPDPLDLRIQSIAKRIRAAPVGRSNLVEISFVGEDPEGTAEFVNHLLRQHVMTIADLNVKGSARPLYEEETKQALDRWQKARADLAEFKDKQGANLLAGDESEFRTVLINLQNQLVSAETEVLELSARSDFLAQQLEILPRTIDAEWTTTENDSVRLLRERVLELEIERSQALSRFTPQSTVVQDLDRQIVEAVRLLEAKEGQTLSERTTKIDPSYQALQVDLVQTRARLTAGTARAQALGEQTEIYRERLNLLENSAGELERLENEVKTAMELYRRYSDQEEQARVTSVLGKSGFVNVSVVEPAVAPPTALPSRTGRRTVFLTLAGLLLGTILAFALDALDSTVKSAAQATRLTGVGVIAEIPGS